MALEQPRSTEGLAADAAGMLEVVGQYVHGESWHADVDFVAVGAFLGAFAVQRSVGLFVTGQVG